MSCNCNCSNKQSIQKYDNCNLNEADYYDIHLFNKLSVDGAIGVIHYFQAHPTHLYSILEFYNKMEQAKIRGLVQARVNWGTAANDGKPICGDLECFWKLYNKKSYFYKTILLAIKYQQWFITQQRQKKNGYY